MDAGDIAAKVNSLCAVDALVAQGTGTVEAIALIVAHLSVGAVVSQAVVNLLLAPLSCGLIKEAANKKKGRPR